MHEVAHNTSAPAWARGLLQRKCDCGGSQSAGHEKCDDCKGKSLQRKGTGAAQPEAPASVTAGLHSPGEAMDARTQRSMSRSFGHDFSNVRIHDDASAATSARAVNALAYTVGNHVVFGAGQYAPHTRAGRHLLAHELAHTIQQENSAPHRQGKLRIQDSSSTDEIAADRAADAVVSGAQAMSAAGDFSAVSVRSGTEPQPSSALSEGAAERQAERFADAFSGAPGVGRPTVSAVSALPHGNPYVQALVRTGVESASEPLPAAAAERAHHAGIRDTDQVRVHRNATADSVNRLLSANAYAYGNHIVLGAERRNLTSPSGERTLNHELAHVGQQSAPGTAAPAAQFSRQAYISAVNKKPEPDWATAAEHLNGEPTKIIKAMLKLLDHGRIVKLHAAARVWPGQCSNVAKLTEKEYLKDFPTKKLTTDCDPKPKAKAKQEETPQREPIPRPGSTSDTFFFFEQDEKEPGRLNSDPPTQNPKFIENRLTAVGYGIYLGGYLLYCQGMDKPIFLPESHVDFVLKQSSIASDAIYDNRDLALKAQERAGREPGAPPRVAYYWGAGGEVVAPTIFSPATTPRTIKTMLEAIQELARVVQEELVYLAISMVGGAILGKILGRIARVGTGPIKRPNFEPPPVPKKLPRGRGSFDELEVPALRQQARVDPEAAEALQLRYKKMPDAELGKLAKKGDGGAQSALDARTPANTTLKNLTKGQGPFSQQGVHQQLTKDLANARTKGGIRRTGRTAVDPNRPVEGGTMCAARTNVKGLENDLTIGRSPAAGGKVNPKSEFPPATDPKKLPQTHAHAEQDAADQIAAKLKGKKPEELRDKRVWMLVEQEPCSTCAQGIGNMEVPGVLRKLSEKFPDVIFEIKNLTTSGITRLRNGVKLE